MGNKAIVNYYQYVKAQPCVACKTPATTLEPNEADHLKPPSSKLPGQLGPRSHAGLAAYYCLPLCTPCHLSRHLHREQDWYLEHVGSGAYVYGLIVKQVLRYYQGDDADD